MRVFVAAFGFIAIIYGVSAIPYCPGDNWTKYYDRDDPTGNGDYETLKDLRKQHPEICAHPIEVDVRLTSGLWWDIGGNYIHPDHKSASYGFACVNKYQKKYYKPPCKDYKIRFCCLPEEPKCPGYWSPYYDRDDPSATGDWEDLHNIRKKYPVCKYPVAAWAQLVNGKHYLTGGDKVHLSTKGFVCKNKEQKDHKCHDYKVKFCCVFKTPSCDGKWTDYFDRDDPSATGDWETLKDIRKKYPKVCSHPSEVQGALKDGRPYQAAYENVHISKEKGLICENKHQTDKRCHDYKVRFCCPKAPVCYWTDWYDVDDPSGNGDYETIQNLRKNHHFCKYPKKIDARDRKTHKDAYHTGQKISHYDTKHGFVCENKKQGYDKYAYRYRQCYDYKVRLYCCE